MPFSFVESDNAPFLAEVETYVDVGIGDNVDIAGKDLTAGRKYKVWIKSQIHSENDEIPYPVDFVLAKLELPQ